MALTQISTDGVKSDAITAGKIPAKAVGSCEIADDAVGSAQIADDGVVQAAIADDAVGADQIADDAVVQAAIADDAVDEARLQISNAGSNGQYLQKQSGNTGGLTWAAVTGTTINNNANNRLITGSGTANTLEGEANLTYDGTDLTCGGKIEDSKGDVRVTPVVYLSGAHTITSADIGKTICTQGANNITLTKTNMVAGAMITIVNTHSSDITVEDGNVNALRKGGDSATVASVTLASYAVATALWLASDTVSICGTGVS